jgi:dTDP-4-amino-4,6-dideoxygalactose transaminase
MLSGIYFIVRKRKLALIYKTFFKEMPIKFVEEPNDSKSNFWLNAILLSDLKERDKFLEDTNDNGIMTRPIWKLMNNLPIYSSSQTGNLENATWLENRIVNIPSSVRI